MHDRLVELVLLYFAAPTVFAWLVRRVGYRGAMFPVLWVITLGCLGTLLHDASFDRAALYRLPLDHPQVRIALIRFGALMIPLAIVSRVRSPEWFLWLPLQRPKLWWLLVVGYPLVSALPQGILWRVFFVHRYSELLGGLWLFGVGGLAFGVAHLTFRNPIAIALTTIGGVVFLDTYRATHSMWLAVIEHGAYGVAVFTFGLGRFLYLPSRELSRFGRGLGQTPDLPDAG